MLRDNVTAVDGDGLVKDKVMSNWVKGQVPQFTRTRDNIKQQKHDS